MSQDPHTRRSITAVAVALEGSLVVVAIGLGLWLGRSPLVGVAVSSAAGLEQLRAVLWGVAAALPMALGMLLIDWYPVGPLRGLKVFTEEQVIPMFRGTATWQLALISLTAGCGEELLFRGLLQQLLVEKISVPWGSGVGLAIASIAFGLCHGVTKTYAVLAGMIGVYLGGLLLLSGNVLVPIVAHALYDFVALLYLLRDEPAAGEVSEDA